MASSGVWENIILTKTPTFDGVCGMLFSIIIFVETILPDVVMFANVLNFGIC